jgi:hypothetical protein
MRHRGTMAAMIGVWLVIGGAPAGAALSGAGRAALFESDARLTRVVQFEALQAPLDEALAPLGDQTGVLLRAEGEAADLRVTAFLRGVPLRLTLERLATLFHLTWRRAGEADPPEYALSLSEDDQRAVEAAKAAEWARFRANIRRLITAAAHPSVFSGDRLDRAAHRIMSHAPQRSAGKLLAVLPDSLLDPALRGARVRVPVSRLSPLQQRAFEEYLGALRAQQETSRRETATGASERGPRMPQPAASAEERGLTLGLYRSFGDGEDAGLLIGHWGIGPIGAALLSLSPTHVRGALGREEAPAQDLPGEPAATMTLLFRDGQRMAVKLERRAPIIHPVPPRG